MRGADRLLLLGGDILYHGPRNDLPEEYAPKEIIALLNPLGDCSVSGATLTVKSIRWCWSSRFWPTTVSCMSVDI